MHFRLGRGPKAPIHQPSATTPLPPVKKGDALVEATGERFIISHIDRRHTYLILRPDGAPKDATDIRYLTAQDFDPSQWTHIPSRRKEVSDMARPVNLPTPPKMTRAEWLKRDKTTVTLTRAELEQLSQLLAAGHVLIRDGKSVSPKLKAAMTKLGVPTKGL
jgi:hypothetical protein